MGEPMVPPLAPSFTLEPWFTRMPKGQTQGQTLSLTPKVSKEAAKEPPRRPSALVKVEAEIEDKEREVAELERKLAEDWANVDTAAAYRRAREELEGLLERWEAYVDETRV